MRQPNIVYLHVHDLGRFCEPMGYAIPSPNLMRLAQQGVLLRQCHASSPTCAPSRAALVTGQHPHCCGMLGHPHERLGYRLDDYNKHLGAFLRRQGYRTALAGVQHVARPPMAPPLDHLPYDRFLTYEADGQQRPPSATVPAAVDFLQEQHDQPFFLSVGLVDPHRNNQVDRAVFINSQDQHEPADMDQRARYCQPWPHMPDNPVTRREMANFRMGVATMDGDLGRLLAVLDQPAHRASTLLIFTTDHGPGVCEMKLTLTDRGTGVTTIIRGPQDPAYGEAGLFAGGRVSDALCQHLDLYPTIAELLGVDAPDHCQGRSLLPLVRDEGATIHDAIFTELTYQSQRDPRPYRAIRTDRWKYIRCYQSDLKRGVDRGPAQAWWEEHGYLERPVPAEQLIDLYFDPNEAGNLAHDPACAEVLADLRGRLDAWQEATDDPIRHGIPLPPAMQG